MAFMRLGYVYRDALWMCALSAILTGLGSGSPLERATSGPPSSQKAPRTDLGHHLSESGTSPVLVPAPGSILPVQPISPFTSVVGIGQPVGQNFVKQVLRLFFTELKKHPNLVEEILKHDAYEELPSEVLPVPLPQGMSNTATKWQYILPFTQNHLVMQGQQEVQQQPRQYVKVQPAQPYQDDTSQKVSQKRDGQSFNQADVSAMPLSSQQQNQQQRTNQQQVEQPERVPNNSNNKDDGLNSEIAQFHTGSGNVGPSDLNSYAAYPRYAHAYATASSSANQNSPERGAQGDAAFYELDNPAYYYYFYNDENETPAADSEGIQSNNNNDKNQEQASVQGPDAPDTDTVESVSSEDKDVDVIEQTGKSQSTMPASTQLTEANSATNEGHREEDALSSLLVN